MNVSEELLVKQIGYMTINMWQLSDVIVRLKAELDALKVKEATNDAK